jgi:hypothetical protein
VTTLCGKKAGQALILNWNSKNLNNIFVKSKTERAGKKRKK